MLGLGRYRVRVADTEADVRAAQRLRGFAFLGAERGCDSDSFDELCQHFLVEEVKTGRLVCVFRMLMLSGGGDIPRSYSAQYYDLSGLQAFQGHLVEMGRFCMHPDVHDPDVLRVAWAAMTRFVDENQIDLLFGCASFSGTDASRYLDSFAMLRDKHIAPQCWLPRVKASKVFRFAAGIGQQADAKRALRHMPPMLRSYLMMGGWVSDHAVVDEKMNTLHVFTGVEVKAIPPQRKRLLRALAG
jgi:putative hemolysin